MSTPTTREATDAVRRAVRVALADVPVDALVMAACSGGPDSTALAAALAHQGPRLRLRIGAVVVDHGLQSGSAAVAAGTAEWLRGNGFELVRVLVVAPSGYAGGPENAARAARYAAIDEYAAEVAATAVLVGHTRDDQAETVLLGLARGSGARSLAGMAAVRGRYRRPLLDVARAVVHAAVPAGAPVVHDLHNVDPAYARARVRATVLPLLETELGPGVAAALARSARLLRADADALDAWAERELGALSTSEGLDLGALAALPDAVRTRVLRRAAVAAGCPAGSLTAAHVDALDRLVVGWRGQGAPSLPGGVQVSRGCGRLTLRPPDASG